ncbi:hypothetical protein OS493_022808 [Desmophyllum pertusum]|uniref:Bactericidal permeability-increasing protein n=1 Tax=Desmophyllum pertusum TaxID=174260 RepID=A0A9W9ZZH7_9CNID|nr:hypothetical protein OS493_022808 [Desmophyllum pertusum]
MKSMANILFVLTSTILISECYLMQDKSNPGIRLRVTNNGLQYADNVGIKTLFERLRKDNIEDITRNEGNLEYSMSKIKNDYASIASSSFLTAPGEGLILQATGIDLDFTGRLKYAYKKKVWGHWVTFLRDTVNVAFKAREIGFKLKTRIGADSAGRPTISTRENDCSSEVGSVDVTFSGNRASMIYNKFSGMIERKIKDKLKEMICKKAREAINKDGAKYLATFPVLRDVSNVAQIDYSLVASPTFTSKYTDIPLKGNLNLVENLTLQLSSLVYHEEGELQRTIRPEDLPRTSKLPLNTKSFEMFLYKLYEMYPERPVFLKLYTTKAPVFTSSRSGINVTVTGNVEVYVIAKNGAHVYALTVGLKANLAGSLGVKYGNLTLHTKSFTAQVHLVRSAIGDIKVNIRLLQWFLNDFIKSGDFVKKLNVIGDRGFPLPMFRNIVWEDTAISTGQGFTLIKTNLKYLPNH